VLRQRLVGFLLIAGIFASGIIIVSSNYFLEASTLGKVIGGAIGDSTGDITNSNDSTQSRPAGVEQITLTPFITASSLEDLIVIEIPRFLIAVGGVVGLIFFLINAMKYLVNAGNEAATSAAKQGMIFAGIGLAVVVFAFAIVSVLKNILGFT